MTLVNHETGEIVETLDKVSARRLTDRIRLLAETVAEQMDKMAGLIDEARIGSAWLALGYRSWTEYVSTEFANVLPRLDREPRREFVRELATRGMSTRAIAPIVGVHHDTVATDIRSSGVGFPTPDDAAQAGAQDRIDDRAAKSRDRQYKSLDALVSQMENEAMPSAPVIGIDGKTYTRPEPKLAPVVLVGADADYANAEKAAMSLSRAIAKLLEFQHSNMRDAMRRFWSLASKEVPPTPRSEVTPEHMRAAAAGLLALADEWEK